MYSLTFSDLANALKPNGFYSTISASPMNSPYSSTPTTMLLILIFSFCADWMVFLLLVRYLPKGSFSSGWLRRS